MFNLSAFLSSPIPFPFDTKPKEDTMNDKQPSHSMARRLAFTGTAIACASALLLASATAQAQDKPVMLKLSSWVPAQHPLNPSLQAWADDIKKASNGTITATLFPSEQLGKAFDHYDMARDGIADFAYVNPGYQPGRFPIMAGASLPFQFANGKGGSAAIDNWYRNYAANEMKDVKFCFAFVHDPGTFHARKKITLPTDIKGMKVRPATSTVGQMITSLGGTNVQASAPEVKPSSAIEEANDDKDPIEITEKKPLEARDTKASEGDNLSGEEVDKW